MYLKMGGLVVEDCGSQNGTVLELFSDSRLMEADRYDEYTNHAIDAGLLRRMQEYAESKGSRHSIGKDTPIDGGVYEADPEIGMEAILVNKETYPVGYNRAMKQVLQIMTTKHGIEKRYALHAVYTVVDAMLQYDNNATEELMNVYSGGLKNNTIIPLDTFITVGYGVCRHQALFVAQLLEGLIGRGVLGGKVSVDRNAIHLPNDEYGGHAWARYTTSDGKVYIIDVAQHKIGLLTDFVAQREAGEEVWDYERLDEKQQRILETRGALHLFGVPKNTVNLKPYMDEKGVIVSTPFART